MALSEEYDMSDIGDILRDIDKPDASDLGDYTKSIRFARILNVYDASILESSASARSKYGKAEILFLDGLGTVPTEIPILSSWFSWTRGSGIMFMPEQNDIVACLMQHNGYPVIIGFLPYKWDETAEKPVKIRKSSVGFTKPLYKGEVCIKSSAGGYVLLNKNGSVEIDGVDSSVNEMVVSEIDGNNNEVLFNRTLDEGESGVSKTVVGKRYLTDGTPKYVGNFPQIFESGVSTHYTQSIDLPYSESVTFNLQEDAEITEVKSVEVVYTQGNATKRVTIGEKQYTLVAENVYTPGSRNDNEVYYKPATVEKNSIKYTLTIPNKKFSNATIHLTYDAKVFLGGVRVNSGGDVFLDGRNVVVRSSNENATLVLTDDGRANLRGGGNTSIGNADGGLLRCTQAGVMYSNGIGRDAMGDSEAPITKMNLYSALGAEDPSFGSLFFISDNLPLFRLFKNGDTWDYKTVSDEEYAALSIKSRATVNKLTLSMCSFFLTKEKLANLLLDDATSYGDLKASVK